MVKSIINQGITDYGEDITTTDNPTTMTRNLWEDIQEWIEYQELQNLELQK